MCEVSFWLKKRKNIKDLLFSQHQQPTNNATKKKKNGREGMMGQTP